MTSAIPAISEKSPTIQSPRDAETLRVRFTNPLTGDYTERGDRGGTANGGVVP